MRGVGGDGKISRRDGVPVGVHVDGIYRAVDTGGEENLLDDIAVEDLHASYFEVRVGLCAETYSHRVSGSKGA